MGFIPEMQDWFDILKSINIINHANKLKKKNYMIISTNAEKIFDKIHLTSIHDKNFQRKKTHKKTEIEKKFLNLMNTYKKPIAKITLKSDRLHAFPPKTGPERIMPAVTALMLEVLTRIMKQENEIKSI